MLAAIGLFLTLITWEATFKKAFRDPNSTDFQAKEIYVRLNNFMTVFVILTTGIAILVCYHKYRCRLIWQEYKHSMVFYKTLVWKQVELGLMDADDLTENFTLKKVGMLSVLTDWQFLCEVFMLLLIPYPI